MKTKIFYFLLILGMFSLFLTFDVLAQNQSQTVTGDLNCLKTAVEKRETALQAAFEKFATTWKNALETRKQELLAAWGLSDKNQRRTAIQLAHSKFLKTKIEARSTYNKERLAAWAQFRKDKKSCKVVDASPEPSQSDSL
jgi:hypothetical protein